MKYEDMGYGYGCVGVFSGFLDKFLRVRLLDMAQGIRLDGFFVLLWL